VRRLLFLSSSVVFVETIFFAALGPLLPQLSEELGLSKAESGALVAMYALGGVVGAIPGGWLATRIGIKPTLVTGLVALTGMCIAFGLAESYALLCLARFGQGFAAALCWNASFAWLVSVAPRERRGEAIGFAMSAAIAGALLGPVLGAVASTVGHAPAFGGVAVLVVALALWALQTPRPPQGAEQPLRLLWTAVRTRRVLAAMWLLMLPSLLFGTLGVLGPLQLDRLGWGTIGIAATFVVSAAIEAVMNPAIGRLSDRRGRLVPIRFGLVAAGAISLVIPWIGDRWVLSVFVILAGMSYGTFWAPATARLSESWESLGIEHALGFALMNFAWAPGHIVGSALGGSIAEVAGDAAAYAVLAGLCGATLVGLRHASAGRAPGRATEAATSG
jgi:predicted MFS family arabinose efflux permease